MNDEPKKRRRCMGCLVASALAAIVLGIPFVWFFFGDTIDSLRHRRPFDADLWRNWEKVEHDHMWPPRLCMIDDLMSSGRLDGLTSNQVVELLGSPHSKSFPFGAVDCDIHYVLGPERGFMRIDHEWLFITFGEDGRVNRYWLYRD
jgi:hypothetical protein